MVVGGGSAGCVVAGELAERPGVRVLVLERGRRAEEHPETLRADGYKDAFANDAVISGALHACRRPHCGNQRVFVGSGSVLGGSGSVNGMVYTRGAREDYAEWPSGWRWNDVVAGLRGHRGAAASAPAAAHAVDRGVHLGGGRVRLRAPRRTSTTAICADVIGYEWMNYEGDGAAARTSRS